MPGRIILDGAVFTGELRGDMPCGRGTMRFDDGTTFSGVVDYASQRGSGVWRYADGSELRGGFTVCPDAPAWCFTAADGTVTRGIVCYFVAETEMSVDSADTASRTPDSDELTQRICAELVSELGRNGIGIEYNARTILVDFLRRSGVPADDAVRGLNAGPLIRVPQVMSYLNCAENSG